jgi:hypothetical protein
MLKAQTPMLMVIDCYKVSRADDSGPGLISGDQKPALI